MVELTRAPFDFRETKAALSVCNPGSLSFPLIIDVRPFLAALHGDRALPLELFAATVFHETMHRYVNDRRAVLPGATTPLLEKYRAEPAPVRNHIHLFALVDDSYRRLRRYKDPERLVALDAASSLAAVFTRARAIVAAEGTERVICEISANGCGGSTTR